MFSRYVLRCPDCHGQVEKVGAATCAGSAAVARERIAKTLHDASAPVLTGQGWTWERLGPGKQEHWLRLADAVLRLGKDVSADG